MANLVDAQFYEELSAALPEDVAGALELLSVPHWIDDVLATEIVSGFGTANGTTMRAVADVKRLPFISPHGRRGWRVAGSARDHFNSRMEGKAVLYRSLNEYLASYFRKV